MPTLYVSHPAFLDHLTGPGHPERPDRIRAVERALEQERFANLARVQAPEGAREVVELVHPTAYVDEIADAAPESGLVRLDPDTVMSPGAGRPSCTPSAGPAIPRT